MQAADDNVVFLEAGGAAKDRAQWRVREHEMEKTRHCERRRLALLRRDFGFSPAALFRRYRVSVLHEEAMGFRFD